MVDYSATDFGKRIINYVYSGDIEVLRTLLELNVVSPDQDIFHINNVPHTILDVISKRIYSCPNYKEMIDAILCYGHVDVSASPSQTPLQHALISRNFPVAAYLITRGGTYNLDYIHNYNVLTGSNLLLEFEKETSKANDQYGD